MVQFLRDLVKFPFGGRSISKPLQGFRGTHESFESRLIAERGIQSADYTDSDLQLLLQQSQHMVLVYLHTVVEAVPQFLIASI